MKKMFFVVSFVAVSLGAKCAATDTCLNFVELPCPEGTLYVALSSEGRDVVMRRICVDGDSVSLNVDLSSQAGKDVEVRAFLDVNDNGELDLDAYGRPSEPCLLTKIIPSGEVGEYTFRLVQY